MKVLFLSSTKTFVNSVSFLHEKVSDVIQVKDFNEAENLLYREDFDVAVIADNFNSSLLAFEFIEKIKNIKKDLPVVFLAFSEDSAHKARIYGADEVLTLPYVMTKPEVYLKDVVEKLQRKPFYQAPYFKETEKEDKLD
jgi:DNA-binding response OmpR family regulator